MKKVLIIDDSPLITSLLKKALEKNGYEVCGSAKNGKEGFDLYQQFKPDISFMDVNMPIMNGIEAAKKILETDSNAKIIMLTAVGDENTINQALNIGVSAYLKKPFNDFQIISAISKILTS